MYFEHVTKGIEYAFGVGPVDALMNAMYSVRRRFYEFDDVTPQANPKAASKAALTKKPRAAQKAPKRKSPATR